MEPGPVFVSAAWRDIPRPDFIDVAAVVLPPGSATDPTRWAEEIFSLSAAPLPVKLMMSVRQVLAPLLGIPTGSQSVFSVDEVNGEEALIAADDVHLDFRVGVGVDVVRGLVRVTTVVRLKGWRGRLYFLPVRLLHSVVVHALLRAAAGRLSVASGAADADPPC